MELSRNLERAANSPTKSVACQQSCVSFATMRRGLLLALLSGPIVRSFCTVQSMVQLPWTKVTLSSNFLSYSSPVVMAHRSSDFATSINAMIPDRFLCCPGAKRSSIRDRGSTPILRYAAQAQLLSSSASILISSS